MFACTWFSRVEEQGSRGLQNVFMEPMAAGKAGAENRAATRLIRNIHNIISSSLLQRKKGDRQTDRKKERHLYVSVCVQKVEHGAFSARITCSILET